MREIKFRVWNGVRFNYGYVNRKGSQLYWDKHYDPQLFTGIKDKNGVEIYEGDILTGNAVVKWYNCLTWDSGGSPHPGFYTEAWTWSQHNEDGELSYHEGFTDEVEVIGNLCENPELVK